MPETTIINHMTFLTWKYFYLITIHVNTIIRWRFISSYVFYQKYIIVSQNPFDTQCECLLFFLKTKSIGIHQTTKFLEEYIIVDGIAWKKQDMARSDRESNMKPNHDSSNTNFCDDISK